MELRPITKTVKTPAANFTGDVYLNPVFSDDDAPLVVGLVRFTPGARTNWHSHANGQLLVCTEVVGLVAGRDGTIIRLRASPSGPRQGRSTGTAASPIRGTALSVHVEMLALCTRSFDLLLPAPRRRRSHPAGCGCGEQVSRGRGDAPAGNRAGASAMRRRGQRALAAAASRRRRTSSKASMTKSTPPVAA